MMKAPPSGTLWKKLNSPPTGGRWVWRAEEMINSPAWRALPPFAKSVIERLEIEHSKHGGAENGELVCTYDDFEAYGIRRKTIPKAIAVAVALGFIEVGRSGRSYGIARQPSTYRLTWLPRCTDQSPASNRWNAIASVADAEAAVATALASFSSRPGLRTRQEQKRNVRPRRLPVQLA